MMSDPVAYLAGGGALSLVLAVVSPPVWRRVRRMVALVDVLTGRPERYSGDPEARPSLPQQLDDIRRHLGNGAETPLRQLVEQHGERIEHVEQRLARMDVGDRS